jgi:hypothetical protein
MDFEKYDHGPLRTYEITWKSGYIETVQGHQVMFGSDKLNLGAGMFGAATAVREELEPRFTVHGEFDGRWRLVISAPEKDLLAVRDITDREQVPGGSAP